MSDRISHIRPHIEDFPTAMTADVWIVRLVVEYEEANFGGVTEELIELRVGSMIVFEGLDKTGKSTQLELLRDRVRPESVTFAHMPSGGSAFTSDVYQLLESDEKRPSSPLAQQLAHLACHAESIDYLKQALEVGSLVLDRWWWSTMAYGWFGGSIASSGLSKSAFAELISSIWKPLTPSIVFVFSEPHQSDKNNKADVSVGYQTLVDEFEEVAMPIRRADPSLTHAEIIGVLRERGLLAE